MSRLTNRSSGPSSRACIYPRQRTFCVACHQPDGRGIPGGAANFLDDTSRLAKPDRELMETIAMGNESKGMPPFGTTLSTAQRRAVLAYIRATFGEPGRR